MPFLFSYGTLQQPEVQISTFGRLLTGEPDSLVGYSECMVEVGDPEVVKTSGKTHHPIVKFTGESESLIGGTVFEVTDAEIKQADKYEVSAYKRVKTSLASGKDAWVYVDAKYS